MALLSFKSEKLTFCFKPNILGLAALHLAFKKCAQPPDEEPLASVSLRLLGIDASQTDVIERLELAIRLLEEARDQKADAARLE